MVKGSRRLIFALDFERAVFRVGLITVGTRVESSQIARAGAIAIMLFLSSDISFDLYLLCLAAIHQLL